jgi:hypothetical protein
VVVLSLVGLAYFAWRNAAEVSVNPAGAGTAGVAIDQGPASGSRRAAATAPQSSPDVVPVPVNYQFPGVTSVVVANTTEELLSRYTPEQQAQIRGFYAEFGRGGFNLTEYAVKDVFSFRTAEQLRWLITHGYPSPDDVLVASAMTDDELADLADNGNFKATAFYLGRLSTTASAAPPTELPRVWDAKKRAEFEDRVLATGSAFGAYVMAKTAIAEKKQGMALAAYLYADRLGDGRGRDFAHHFGGTQNVDAREAVISYMALQARAGMYNPQLNDPRYLARTPTFPKWN